jgi:hypothetical protein
LFPHLLCKQSQLDVAFVFIAIANDERIGVGINGQYGVKLWLRSGFQPNMEALSVRYDFFYYLPHLIYFDGIDQIILRLIIVFFGSGFKAVGNFFDPVIQNFRKTK